MIYLCRDKERETLLKEKGVNGLAFVEVAIDQTTGKATVPPQLRLRFFTEHGVGSLTTGNIRIEQSEPRRCLPSVVGLRYPGFLSNELSEAFIRKLGEREDPVSDFLFGRFSEGLQQAVRDLERANLSELQRRLTPELDHITKSEAIFDEARFQGISLRPETEALLNWYPRAENQAQVNRMLLEDAYDLQLQKNRELLATLRQPGNSSVHTLRLVKDSDDLVAPDGFDPVSSVTDFSFTIATGEQDCRPRCVCPPEKSEGRALDYLAKDYASFRRLLLERLKWQEQHGPDLGLALIELIAYVGDYLSYQQDAVATEAYLGTARRRVSVRRHARLIDYRLHEGCNARVWVHVQVSWKGESGVKVRAGTQFLTRPPGEGVRPDIVRPSLTPDSPATKRLIEQGEVVVFEAMHETELFEEHNRMCFYTWGDRRCCLPQGATRATLAGHYSRLQTGGVLIFEEVLDPNTGRPGDSDVRRAHAVQLTQVSSKDSAGNPLRDPVSGAEITEIAWSDEDALPFAFCISARTDSRPEHPEFDERYFDDVSVAHGNIVLADHGRMIGDFFRKDAKELAAAINTTDSGRFVGESLSDGGHTKVPEPNLFRVPSPNHGNCEASASIPVPSRFYPALGRRNLTYAVVYIDNPGSANGALTFDPREALPQIRLISNWQGLGAVWEPKLDLLNSDPDATEFVVEAEENGKAYLRFGNNQHGRRPQPGTSFRASYRVGNGTAGNVGNEAIAYLVSDDWNLLNAVRLVRNPLPAQGGLDRESIEAARRIAPARIQEQQRAVTEQDYSESVQKAFPDSIQKATATFRWTGSWRTVFIAADPRHASKANEQLKKAIKTELEEQRLAGWDLELEEPRYVGLRVDMRVRVEAGFFTGHVKEALLDAFSNRELSLSETGFFHPDNFTFGQSVALSQIYARALKVRGVASVQVTRFQRQADPEMQPLDDIQIGPHEIARLDNNPDFRERGVLKVTMESQVRE